MEKNVTEKTRRTSGSSVIGIVSIYVTNGEENQLGS